MTTSFQQSLSIYRDNSATKPEQGSYFAKLIILLYNMTSATTFVTETMKIVNAFPKMDV